MANRERCYTRSDGEYWSILETGVQGARRSGAHGVDSQCPTHQVCSGTQDRQEGQCVDMQVASCRIAETELHTVEGAAGAQRPDKIPQQIDPAQCV